MGAFLIRLLGLRRIFRSKDDLYHVHSLLQDCYLPLKLEKRPIDGQLMKAICINCCKS